MSACCDNWNITRAHDACITKFQCHAFFIAHDVFEHITLVSRENTLCESLNYIFQGTMLYLCSHCIKSRPSRFKFYVNFATSFSMFQGPECNF